MDQQLGYANEELSLLSEYLREYGQEHPAQAANLGLAGDGLGDPQVRILLQAVAVLNGRIRRKLADELPEVTDSFLEICAPHLLRPFPSSSIVHFNSPHKASASPASITVPRGALLKSRQQNADGVICKFKTVYPVDLSPAMVTQACFRSVLQAPPQAALPHDASGEIAITIEWDTASRNSPAQLRLFIDAERSLSAAVIDALFLHTSSCYVEQGQGKWQKLEKSPLSLMGFSPEEALVPADPKASSAHRLLTEYFCFPAKFNFISIDLSILHEATAQDTGKATLHFVLNGVPVQSGTARLLSGLNAQHLLVGCSPVVNLFTKAASPIRVTYQTTDYPLIADALRPGAYEIYSVDAVLMSRTEAADQPLVEFRPYYSLRHADGLAAKGHYWIHRKDEELARMSPGAANTIAFADIDFDPVSMGSATVSVDLTCTNGRLPCDMPYGAANGDFMVEASVGGHQIKMLRRPSVPCPRPSSRAVHWKLASFLALNLQSLSSGGIHALRELLLLHDFSRSELSLQQISGIAGFEVRAARAWLHDDFGGTSLRGIEVRMSIEEAAFAGSSIYQFTQVIDRVLGLLVHLNSFSQLTVISKETGKELLRCPPRTGELNLL